MAINRATFDTLYQTYYPDEHVPYLLPENLPLLAMAVGGNTDNQVSGLQTDLPWLYGPSAGVSQTFSVAQAASNNAPSAVRIPVRLSQGYKLVDFSDKDEKLSNGTASYGDLMETVMLGVRMDMLNKLDQLMHGTGDGVRCLVAAVSSGTTITCNTQTVETLFEIGDTVNIVTPTIDGSAPTLLSGPFRVTSVGQNTITVNSAVTVAIGNGIALNGDSLGVTTAALNPGLMGVGLYNPTTAPSPGESFIGSGVDRSTYVNRLSGYRFPGQNFSIEAAIKRLASRMSAGGVPSGDVQVLMHPVDMDALEDKLASHQRYHDSQLGTFSFEAIALNSPLGRLSVVSDPHQNQGQARIYARGWGQLQYRDGLPHPAKLSGGETEEFGANFDGRCVRMRWYAQLRVLDPRKLGNVLLPAIA